MQCSYNGRTKYWQLAKCLLHSSSPASSYELFECTVLVDIGLQLAITVADKLIYRRRQLHFGHTANGSVPSPIGSRRATSKPSIVERVIYSITSSDNRRGRYVN